jgi:hypothetical protein
LLQQAREYSRWHCFDGKRNREGKVEIKERRKESREN